MIIMHAPWLSDFVCLYNSQMTIILLTTTILLLTYTLLLDLFGAMNEFLSVYYYKAPVSCCQAIAASLYQTFSSIH